MKDHPAKIERSVNSTVIIPQWEYSKIRGVEGSTSMGKGCLGLAIKQSLEAIYGSASAKPRIAQEERRFQVSWLKI